MDDSKQLDMSAEIKFFRPAVLRYKASNRMKYASRMGATFSSRARAGRVSGCFLEQSWLAARWFAMEVFVGARGGHAATWGAVDHADLHQIRLVHFLDCVFFFAEGGCEGADAHRTAAILIDQREHEVAVHFV